MKNLIRKQFLLNFKLASFVGNLDIVKLLIKNGADVNALNNDNDSAVSRGNKILNNSAK
jgi:hypothetical protein